MSAYQEGLRQRKILNGLKEKERKRRLQEKEEPPELTRISASNQMRASINRWKEKGVHSYSDFLAYISNKNNGEPKGSIYNWNINKEKYKMIWEIHKEDEELQKSGKRRCSYCEKIRPVNSFAMNKGVLSGFKCEICRGGE